MGRRCSGYFIAAVLAAGCGGGSGSSGGGSITPVGRPPIAVGPVCGSLTTQQRSTQSLPIAGSPNVFVPDRSIERLADAGVKVHTDLLLYVGKGQTRQSGPTGLSPAQIAAAYGVPAHQGAGAIAVVDAFNYPTALNDFNYFANQFGLPTESSTNAIASTNSVFQVVYAAGQQPSNDGGWAQESAVDIEWAHAMAPAAKIYLVEAASDNLPDIMNAVLIAKAISGVKEVSTSFGTIENGCSYVSYDGNFIQSGVAFFASSGDSAGARDFPALSQNVVAVGGTTLNVSSSGDYESERVWNSTGCGPSAYEPRPVFQDPLYSVVGLYRAANDIVADADPDTGVSAYDSFPYQGFSGWLVAGGTSVPCPIVAGIVNGSGVTFNSSQDLNTELYSLEGSLYFHHITAGSADGFTAASPWSFATGLGSPNGLAAGLAANRSVRPALRSH